MDLVELIDGLVHFVAAVGPGVPLLWPKRDHHSGIVHEDPACAPACPGNDGPLPGGYPSRSPPTRRQRATGTPGGLPGALRT